MFTKHRLVSQRYEENTRNEEIVVGVGHVHLRVNERRHVYEGLWMSRDRESSCSKDMRLPLSRSADHHDLP